MPAEGVAAPASESTAMIRQGDAGSIVQIIVGRYGLERTPRLPPDQRSDVPLRTLVQTNPRPAEYWLMILLESGEGVARLPHLSAVSIP
jgi:hypothetical protein